MEPLTHSTGIIHPFPEPPAPGAVIEVAPGILWTRISLPFRLDHVNIYLIEDGDGWAVLDTGLGTEETMAAWETLVAGALAGARLTRLIVTHMHPDHIGLAGWLCRRFGIGMLTSQTTWLTCLHASLSPDALDATPYREMYMRNGLDAATTDIVVTQGHRYLRMVTPLPPTFRRVVAGDIIAIGRRVFQVLTGDGHAPEQVMLYCPEDRLFFAADQVLAKISPNVGVWPVDPDGDPLALFLRSQAALRAGMPADTLVLPGHHLPFRGLHFRCEALAAHHEERCGLIAEACAQRPCTVVDLLPVLFKMTLDPHQLGFAFGETHAHVNYMVGQGRLRWVNDSSGISRVMSA